MSTDNQKARKQHTPQLSRVVEAITSGSYDDDLLDIQKALQSRRAVLEKDVLELVKQVFGPQAEVVSEAQQPTEHRTRVAPFEETGNAFIKKAQAEAGEESDVPKDALSDLDAVERQMASESATVGREGGGAIINGLSASQIGD